MHAMVLEGLGHIYRNGKGVRGVDLAVDRGEVFGFLGPNGAGKTTLIRTILGFIAPTSGRGSVLDLDVVKDSTAIRAKVGYLPSSSSLYDFLSARENLEFALKVRGKVNGHFRERLEYLAGRLEVDLGQKFKTLSRGNKQKVAIINALVHEPELLILDEPTTGLDPLVQETVRSIISEERQSGKTVFMSSHDLAEVEAVADRVGIIRNGVMVAVDRVENLKRQRLKHVSFEATGDWSGLSNMPGVSDIRQDGRKVRFSFSGEMASLVQALSGWGLLDMTVTDPPLEEIFLSFYGQEGSKK